MSLPQAYAWLTKEPGPKALIEAVKLCGTLEKPGAADNPLILGWADEVARLFPGAYNTWAGGWYEDDEIPWCGLFMAICHARAGRRPPDKYLSALAWRSFGIGVERPMLGDTLIKSRKGGGHVTMYVAEDATHFHCLGGNQSNAVSIVRYPKAGIDWAFRRPPYNAQPANVRIVTVAAGGAPAAGS
jgi:uncharacterized protein (TIGR02594 family)